MKARSGTQSFQIGSPQFTPKASIKLGVRTVQTRTCLTSSGCAHTAERGRDLSVRFVAVSTQLQTFDRSEALPGSRCSFIAFLSAD
jgi:hypothetical protein